MQVSKFNHILLKNLSSINITSFLSIHTLGPQEKSKQKILQNCNNDCDIAIQPPGGCQWTEHGCMGCIEWV